VLAVPRIQAILPSTTDSSSGEGDHSPGDALVPRNTREQLSHMETLRLTLEDDRLPDLRAFETALFRPWAEFMAADERDIESNPERPESELPLSGSLSDTTTKLYDNIMAAFLAWLHPDNPLLLEFDEVLLKHAEEFKLNKFTGVRKASSIVPAICSRMPFLNATLVKTRAFYGCWRTQHTAKQRRDRIRKHQRLLNVPSQSGWKRSDTGNDKRREATLNARHRPDDIQEYSDDDDFMEEIASKHRPRVRPAQRANGAHRAKRRAIAAGVAPPPPKSKPPQRALGVGRKYVAPTLAMLPVDRAAKRKESADASAVRCRSMKTKKSRPVDPRQTILNYSGKASNPGVVSLSQFRRAARQSVSADEPPATEAEVIDLEGDDVDPALQVPLPREATFPHTPGK